MWEDDHVAQREEWQLDHFAVGIATLCLLARATSTARLAGGGCALWGALCRFCGALGLRLCLARRSSIYDRLVELTRLLGISETLGVVAVAAGQVVEQFVKLVVRGNRIFLAGH